jgi:hypothetical protein
VALASCSAFTAAVGTSALARERAIFAWAAGVSAAPAGFCWVESARLAALEAARAGLDPPAADESKFGERLPPVVPDSAR